MDLWYTREGLGHEEYVYKAPRGGVRDINTTVATVETASFESWEEVRKVRDLIAAAPEMHQMLDRILDEYGDEMPIWDKVGNLLAKAEGRTDETD